MKSLRALAAVATAAATIGGAAVAAPPAMEQSPTGPAAIPAVPQVPAPDGPAMTLAQRYLEVTHYHAVVQKRLDEFFPVLLRLASQANKSLTDQQRAALETAFRETMTQFLPSFEGKAAEVIATHYTTEELTALVTFYETPVGRRIADKSLDLQALMTDSVRSLGPQFGRALIVRFCEKTACPPAMKAMIPNAS